MHAAPAPSPLCRDRIQKEPGVKLAAGCAPRKQRARGQTPSQSPRSVSLDSLPAEILLKILSYLDAVALLCAGCVNRRFYHLASDNFLWGKVYSAAFSPKRSNWKVSSVEKAAESVNVLSLADREAGYWKKEYIAKQIASVRAALSQVLKNVNPYTGLPRNAKEALRVSGLGWVLVLREKSGREHVLEHVDLTISDASVTILWYGKNWPCLATLCTLDLCGVTPVFMDRSKPPPRNGGTESALHLPSSDCLAPQPAGWAPSDPRWDALLWLLTGGCLARGASSLLPCAVVMPEDPPSQRRALVSGSDWMLPSDGLGGGGRGSLQLTLPSLAHLSVQEAWDDAGEEELAFVMANLHVHHLVERSTLGSATVYVSGRLRFCGALAGCWVPACVPYSTPAQVVAWFCHFSIGCSLQIQCAGDRRKTLGLLLPGIWFVTLQVTEVSVRGYIENGYAKLVVISFKNNTEHLPLIGKVGLSWKTDAFEGCVKSCFIMDVTLLDECGKPFWCVSSPVCLRPRPSPPDGPHFLGQTLGVDYAEEDGRVQAELVWIEETQEHFLVSLVLHLSVAKINRWFGTEH
ncbi:PREDICTED: F-box only protein 15 [Condylura cristata]|uniref:F-box only protein 15 n=1 Tax=Condylura cristata TaxID=143302 RepID=UPI000643D4FF|nr:PREDICTED: F-box only protein 15 [Condylura cristata]